MHPKARRILLAILALAFLPALVAQADDSADQKAVRTRREALLKAVNAHDVKAIKTFIDPSYKATEKSGQTHTYQELLQLLDQLFQQAKDFQEADKIEKIETDGSTATVTLTETASFTDPMGNKHSDT